MNKLAYRLISLLLITVGVVIGVIFFSLATWGDLEATPFSSGVTGDESLPSMSCPIVITPGEMGHVRMSVKNAKDKVLNTTVKVQISSGFATLKREESVRVAVQPGESKPLVWDVIADDAVWDRVIFVRLYQYADYPDKSKGGSCGILVLEIPFLSGGQSVGLTIILSLLGMGAGLAIWYRTQFPFLGRMRDATRALVVLVVIVTAGMLTALAGMWLIGLLLLVSTLILIGSIASHMSMP